jgi:hypothetical protein
MSSKKRFLLDAQREESLLGSYLRSLEPPINSLIVSCEDDMAVRRFACCCARMALDVACVDNQELSDILSIAEAFVAGKVDRAQLDAAAITAEQLVGVFEAAEIGPDEDVDVETYQRAFDRARAATAVYACTARLAKCAAAFACYETESIGLVATGSEISAKTREMALTILGGGSEVKKT